MKIKKEVELLNLNRTYARFDEWGDRNYEV